MSPVRLAPTRMFVTLFSPQSLSHRWPYLIPSFPLQGLLRSCSCTFPTALGCLGPLLWGGGNGTVHGCWHVSPSQSPPARLSSGGSPRHGRHALKASEPIWKFCCFLLPWGSSCLKGQLGRLLSHESGSLALALSCISLQSVNSWSLLYSQQGVDFEAAKTIFSLLSRPCSEARTPIGQAD